MHEIVYFVFYIVIFGLEIHYICKINLAFSIFISLILMMLIFINVNPYKTNENKLTILNYIDKLYVPQTKYLSELNLNQEKYPIVIKPHTCSRASNGVEVIKNKSSINNYYEKHNFTKDELIYQQFVPYTNEVGILYEKNLITEKGNIVSIVKKKVSQY